ncbi:MAG: hypothetical protein R2758_08180 [Bacteroidales bacterium]
MPEKPGHEHPASAGRTAVPANAATVAGKSAIPATATSAAKCRAGKRRRSRQDNGKQGVVDSPLGLFAISGMKFEPGHRVKHALWWIHRESDWIETRGLMVSAIEH